MKKKILLVLLVLLMAFMLTGCGDKTNKNSNKTSQTTTEEESEGLPIGDGNIVVNGDNAAVDESILVDEE